MKTNRNITERQNCSLPSMKASPSPPTTPTRGPAGKHGDEDDGTTEHLAQQQMKNHTTAHSRVHDQVPITKKPQKKYLGLQTLHYQVPTTHHCAISENGKNKR